MQLMAAEVRTGDNQVEVGAVRKLFGGIPLSPNQLWDVSSDGQRILVAVPLNPKASEPVTLLQNWTAALKK